MHSLLQYKILHKGLEEYDFAPAHIGDAGIDLRAAIDVVKSLSEDTLYIPTGISMNIPVGYVGIITPKSGLATKKGIVLANTVGIIDSSYTGEIIIPLTKYSNKNIVAITPFQKIAQILIIPYFNYNNMLQVDTLTETIRGADGFGSTDDKR